MILGISLVVQELNKGPRLVFRYPEEGSPYFRQALDTVRQLSQSNRDVKYSSSKATSSQQTNSSLDPSPLSLQSASAYSIAITGKRVSNKPRKFGSFSNDELLYLERTEILGRIFRQYFNLRYIHKSVAY